MSNGIKRAKKSGYTRPVLKEYGSFAKLTASGSGALQEFSGEPPGQRMMRRP